MSRWCSVRGAGPRVTGRYVRVIATRLGERRKDYAFALGELEVYEVQRDGAEGRNRAAGAAVESLDSIEAGRWSRKHLVDGFDSRARLDVRDLERRRDALVDAAMDDTARAARKAAITQFAEAIRAVDALPPAHYVYGRGAAGRAARDPRPQPRRREAAEGDRAARHAGGFRRGQRRIRVDGCEQRRRCAVRRWQSGSPAPRTC